MDEDFDTASFDEAYDYSDFGEGQAFGTGDMAGGSSSTQGNFVDMGLGDGTGGDSLSSILNVPTGTNRTNISNVGSGSNLVYDPTFAQALNVSRGLLPGNTGGAITQDMLPASLRPQIEGEFYDPFGDKPMFFSQGEKFLQETLPGIVQTGPVATIARGIGNFFGNIFSEGRDFAKDATAGIKLPSLKDISEGFTNFVDRFRPRETDTNPMNMLEAAVRDEVPRVDYGTLPPSPFTFGSMPDMTLINARALPEQNLNTGIVSVDPRAAENANRNVAEAIEDLQLVPSDDSKIIGNRNASVNMRRQAGESLSNIVKSFQSPNVERSLLPSGVFSMLPTAEDRRKRDFARDVFARIPSLRQQQFGRFNQDFINRTLNAKPFDDSGTFINLDNV